MKKIETKRMWLVWFFVLSSCLFLSSGAVVQETEPLPIDEDATISLNPNKNTQQQLQERLLPVGLFLVPKVISLKQQNDQLQSDVSSIRQSEASASLAFSSAIMSLEMEIAQLSSSLAPTPAPPVRRKNRRPIG